MGLPWFCTGSRRFEPRDGGFHGFLRGFLGFVPLTSHCDRVGTGFQGFQPLHWSGSVGWFGFDGHSIKFYGRASWWNRKRVLSRLPGLIGFDRVWSGLIGWPFTIQQHNNNDENNNKNKKNNKKKNRYRLVGSLVRSFSFRFLFWAKDKKRKEKKKETNSFFFSVDVAFLHRFHYCGIFFLFDGQRSHAPHLMFFFFYFFLSSRSGFFFVGSLIIRFISLLYCRFSFIADSSDVNQQLPLQKKEKNKKKTAGAPNQSGFGFFFLSFFFRGERAFFLMPLFDLVRWLETGGTQKKNI